MSEASLYETDFALWSERQARRLRELAAQRTNTDVDWENVAEEIETLGRSERREVASLVRLILVHLLKVEFSPAVEPKAGRQRTVARAQSDLAERLSASPSIRPDLPAVIAREWQKAQTQVATELETYAEFDAAALARHREAAFTEGEVLGDAS